MHDLFTAAPPTENARDAVAETLRRAFFADPPTSNVYGTTVDDVLDHCGQAFSLDLLDSTTLRRAAGDRLAENLDDLLLVVACIRGDAAAWHDLEEEMRPLLARMCELRVDELEATLHVSRFLREVRRSTLAIDATRVEDADDDGTPVLQQYTGLQPLRSFLGGPLFSLLQDLVRDGLIEPVRTEAAAAGEPRRLRLAD